MLFASIYSMVRLIVVAIELHHRSSEELQLEVLALRHEVAILRRHVKRPDLFPTGRLILAALARHLQAGKFDVRAGHAAALASRAGPAQVGGIPKTTPLWTATDR